MSKQFINFTVGDLQYLLCQLGPEAPARTPIEMTFRGKIYQASLLSSTAGLKLKNPVITFQEENQYGTYFKIEDLLTDHINTVCIESIRYHKGYYLANSDGSIQPAPGYGPYTKPHTIPSLFLNGAPYSFTKCIEKEVGFNHLPPLNHPGFPCNETYSYSPPAEEVETTRFLRPLSFSAAAYNRSDSCYAPTEEVGGQSRLLSPYSEGGNNKYFSPQPLRHYNLAETYLSG